jgi:hypothetical protein
VAVVIWLVVIPAMKKGKARGKPISSNQYPELVSYIKDAMNAGASKQDIITKLQEAGWPRDAINAAFKGV